MDNNNNDEKEHSKENERKQEKIDWFTWENRRLSRQFNFISMRYTTYNCMFNIKSKLQLPTMVEQTKEEAISSDAHGGESGDWRHISRREGLQEEELQGWLCGQEDWRGSRVTERSKLQHLKRWTWHLPKNSQEIGPKCNHYIKEQIRHTNVPRRRRAHPTRRVYPARKPNTSSEEDVGSKGYWGNTKLGAT